VAFSVKHGGLRTTIFFTQVEHRRLWGRAEVGVLYWSLERGDVGVMIEDDNSRPGQVACRVMLKVVPGSRRDQIVGRLGERLKVKVAAPPEDGKANKAVCRVLAEAVGVGERDVEVVVGHASPEKVVRVLGRRAAELEAMWP
jgi:uncharacterized protein (TIGR00251 family)